MIEQAIRDKETRMSGERWEAFSESELIQRLDCERLPRHVAVIMDGNGRWAEKRNWSRSLGHQEGAKAANTLIDLCLELNIPAVTLYAFSLENWKRPPLEIDMLMNLFTGYFNAEFQQFVKRGIRFRAIGQLDKLPGSIQAMIWKMEAETSHFTRMTVTVAVSYGGRAEIIDGVKQAIRDAREGKLHEDALDEERFEHYLSTRGFADPDLLIRTSGEHRISNFLLWQIAYAELYFTPTLWPDFGRREALLALFDYQQRERRYGATHPAVVSLQHQPAPHLLVTP